MQELILLKLGELVLKGLNRHVFEERLCANIRRRIKHCGKFQITSKQSTIYIEPLNEEADLDAAFEDANAFFGIVALSKAHPCEKNQRSNFRYGQNVSARPAFCCHNLQSGIQTGR